MSSEEVRTQNASVENNGKDFLRINGIHLLFSDPNI